MRRNDLALRGKVKHELKQVVSRTRQCWPSVDGEIAMRSKAGIKAIDHGKTRRKNQGVSFAQTASVTKNIGDLDREQKTYLAFAFAQTKEPSFRRFKFLLEVSEIDRMSEITCAEKGNAFASGPPCQTFSLHLTATSVTEARVDMQISDNAHTRSFPPIC